MTVELPIINASFGRAEITARVQVPCELVGPPDDQWLTVRLLEPGAGRPAGTEITVPAAKVALSG